MTCSVINLTENIRQALDDGCIIERAIFLDLKKAFTIFVINSIYQNTVDHEILLAKHNQQCVRGVSNDWFRSYVFNQQQYVSLNGYDSCLTKIYCGVPQGPDLGPLIFCYISMTLIKP